MRILYVIPGSGGGFYCQNCLRDNILALGMKDAGHDVAVLPMYLPMFSDGAETQVKQSEVFFGAVNLYLKQRFPVLRKMPRWLSGMLDTRPVLKMAATLSSSTRAGGLEKMTLEMLAGEKGCFAAEHDSLARWIASDKPDIVHLSNALLLGSAGVIKKHAPRIPLLCSLQDEHQWVDSMEGKFPGEIWMAIAAKARLVDLFVSVSGDYARKMQALLDIPGDKVRVRHIGMDTRDYPRREKPPEVPALGFISKITPSLGFDILVDAFIAVKKRAEFGNLKLYASGGITRDNHCFIRSCMEKLSRAGFAEDVVIMKEFDRGRRIDMLSKVSLLTVPVPGGEAFGTYLLEAMALGVPVVQPREGGFEEVINITGGGLTYSPNTADNLAESIVAMLSDRQKYDKCSSDASENTRRHFDISNFVRGTEDIYRAIAP